MSQRGKQSGQLRTGAGEPPNPDAISTLDELIATLRAVKIWAGDPSIRELVKRINLERRARAVPGERVAEVSSSTVGYCFRLGRRRLDYDLVFDLLDTMGIPRESRARWVRAWQAACGRPAPSAVTVSTELAGADGSFVGRDTELAVIREASGRHPVLIHGMAGVGKTTLAMHAGRRLPGAHQVLCVDLRGFDRHQSPVEPAAVLEAFLQTLGVSGGHIPKDGEARGRMYRNLVVDRRIVIVLDNAAGGEQVGPLLAGGPEVTVIITSRRALRELDGIIRVALVELTPAESIELLRHLGGERVTAEPEAAAGIVEVCGHLPLAVELAGRHIGANPGWSLADHRERLAALGPQDGVEASLTLSYRTLDPDSARAFRLIGIAPGQQLSADALAAMAGRDLDATRRQLTRLIDDHLVRPAGRDRVQAHELVRAYAAGRAVDEDPVSHRQAALTGLFDHYRASATAAMDTLYPAERARRPAAPATGRPVPSLADPEQARSWLEIERSNLLAATAYAATGGWARHAVDISFTLFRHLELTGRYDDVRAISEHALLAARTASDRRWEAQALRHLATALWRMGRYPEALRDSRLALTLLRETGDLAGEAVNLNSLGVLAKRLGRLDDALAYYRQAIVLLERTGNETFLATTLNNLGSLQLQAGQLEEAARTCGRSLALATRLGDDLRQGRALDNLGLIHQQRGDPDAALDSYRRAISIFTELGDRPGQARTLANLGAHHLRRNDAAQARSLHEQALAIARELGDPALEVETLNNLGDTLRAAGQPGEARTRHEAAANLAESMGERFEQARALDGIARSQAAAGDRDAALRCWQQAYRIYTDLGVPEAERVRDHLITDG